MAQQSREFAGFTSTDRGTSAFKLAQETSEVMQRSNVSPRLVGQEKDTVDHESRKSSVKISHDKETSSTTRQKEALQMKARKHHILRTQQCRRRLPRHKGQFDEFFNYKMDALTDACKKGDVPSALQTARFLADETFVLLFTDLELIMIRLFFIQEKGGRSGINCAAQAGHVEMVEVFLAHLVIERASRRFWAERNLNAKDESWQTRFRSLHPLSVYCWDNRGWWNKKFRHRYIRHAGWVAIKGRFDSEQTLTMLGWLDYVGFPAHFFSREDFDQCRVGALDDRTKAVFDNTLYSFQDILNIVNNVEENTDKPQHADRRNHTIRSHKRLPTLNLDDDFHHDIDGIGSDEIDMDYWSDPYQENTLGCGDSAEPDDISKMDATSLYKCTEDGFNENPDNENAYKASESSDPMSTWIEIGSCNSPLASISRDGHDFDDAPGEIELHWTCCNFTQLESSTRLQGSVPSLGDSNSFQLLSCQDDLSCNLENESDPGDEIVARLNDATTDWAIVQDSCSVNSLTSKPIRSTYLEALLAPPFKVPTDAPRKTHQSLIRRRSPAAIVEEADNESMFDHYFDLEGVKRARGGKSNRMFKGEGRVPHASKHKARR